MSTQTTTSATVPANIAALADDLTGWHPAVDSAVSSLLGLLTADLNADQTQGVIAALGGLADGHLVSLVALIVRHLGNPDANPALADLPQDQQQALRHNGAAYAAAATDDGLTQFASRMAAAIEGR